MLKVLRTLRPAVWDYFEVPADGPRGEVVPDLTMPGTTWFPGRRLNYAETVLQWAGRRPDAVAIHTYSQSREPQRMTYSQLAQEVSRVAGWLREKGVQAGDRWAMCRTLPRPSSPSSPRQASARPGRAAPAISAPEPSSTVSPRSSRSCSSWRGVMPTGRRTRDISSTVCRPPCGARPTTSSTSARCPLRTSTWLSPTGPDCAGPWPGPSPRSTFRVAGKASDTSSNISARPWCSGETTSATRSCPTS
ncbi:hypothetical protein BN11_1010004 [Nostocoides australiense Ben110]|uniref:AMP-dependent synthetase/ligase domain-containing protein n=1 Tax=Nostocoides australiense Ben110 TaxID=1193182 RepID=W6JSQ5_9MICO|nr:hypothetical protein BN11_1010004 [Tetrasphaera australiensis Ben110]